MIVSKLSESLLAKQQELSERLAAIEADLKQGRSANLADQSSERENDEVLDEIYQQTQMELHKIEQTLQMLQAEQYGICSLCGKAIEQGRLDVLTNVKTCIQCAKQEKA
ncbi:TraR/DksA family transcriptional regulator [Thalassotalea ponticola]|uniref:TraR/DksA family transcriptional regulator n=1 Tax=Thalassotalea ponticola TaxID=1523392 RepID=UPI0025B3D983|nr:TraR/DksA C4-type zinc finger protein [Thalassotalea ponticola]MDN3652457.1 TraR/DksA family transcriptional regulator [Thalassotalea ponticola]